MTMSHSEAGCVVLVVLVVVGTFSQDKEEGLGAHWVHEQVTTPHHDYRTWVLPELTHMVRLLSRSIQGSTHLETQIT